MSDLQPQVEQLVQTLREGANEAFAQKMAYFGIDASQALGWRTPALKELAKPHRKNHSLAMALFEQPYHEAKLLAAFTGSSKEITLAQADSLTHQFYSWDLVDQFCGNLFAKASFAWELPERYTGDDREFVRRTGMVMVVQLALKHKKSPDEDLLPFLPQLAKYATDPRNFVKKANSWALRTLGKRSLFLNQAVQELAQNLKTKQDAPSRWVAGDVLREITQEKYLQKLR